MNIPSPFPPPPGLGRLAARSAAVNVPLFAAAAACAAGLVALFRRPTLSQERRAFLKTLATSDCPDGAFLRFYDAGDPIELAERELRAGDSDAIPAIRRALAAAM